MPSLPVLILNLAAYVSWNFGLFRPTRGPPRLLHASPVLLTFSIGIIGVPSEHLCQEIVLVFRLDRSTMPQFRWWVDLGPGRYTLILRKHWIFGFAPIKKYFVSLSQSLSFSSTYN